MRRYGKYVYRKKKHCAYPAYVLGSIGGYCWGYALRKDEGWSDEKIEVHQCGGCEFYRPAKRKKK